MLVSNHSMQIIIPLDSCAIAISYNNQDEEFYTEAEAKTNKLLPPTFERKRTVSVTVVGNGAKFVEKYLTKERVDEQIRSLAHCASLGDGLFVFDLDKDVEEYEKSLKKAKEEALEASTPAYKRRQK